MGGRGRGAIYDALHLMPLLDTCLINPFLPMRHSYGGWANGVYARVATRGNDTIHTVGVALAIPENSSSIASQPAGTWMATPHSVKMRYAFFSMGGVGAKVCMHSPANNRNYVPHFCPLGVHLVGGVACGRQVISYT